MNAAEQVQIPEKLFYRINEVSNITQIKPYVLRYWETEFPMLAPEKDENDQRRYRRNDIELILEIKRLLYTEKFTIAGARKQLRAKNTAPPQSATPAPEMVRQGGAAQTTLPEGDKRTRIQSSLTDLRNDVDELFRFMA